MTELAKVQRQLNHADMLLQGWLEWMQSGQECRPSEKLYQCHACGKVCKDRQIKSRLLIPASIAGPAEYADSCPDCGQENELIEVDPDKDAPGLDDDDSAQRSSDGCVTQEL